MIIRPQEARTVIPLLAIPVPVISFDWPGTGERVEDPQAGMPLTRNIGGQLQYAIPCILDKKLDQTLLLKGLAEIRLVPGSVIMLHRPGDENDPFGLAIEEIASESRQPVCLERV